MRHVTSLRMLLLALTFFTNTVNAAMVASDDFNAANLNTSLWTARALGDGGTVRITDRQLILTKVAGISGPVSGGKIVAPRVTQTIDNTDFEIEVKFASVPTADDQIQGLSIEQDSTKFLRFEVFIKDAALRARVISQAAGTSVTHYNQVIGSANPIYMRVRRAGNQWTQSFSFDGLNWADTVSFSYTLRVSRMGPYAANSGQPGPTYSAVIDYVFNTAAPIDPEDGGTPPADTAKPFIHAVAGGPNGTTAAFSWATDEPASTEIRYGLTTSYEAGKIVVTDLTYDHAITISGLLADRTYNYRLVSRDALGNVRTTANQTFVTSTSPTIDVWYGPTQNFGALGVSQQWVNVLGNVSDPDGISSLRYSLNGQPDVALSRGPDGRRLVAPGDFNIELDRSQLINGLNSVRITAVDAVGSQAVSTVTVDYRAGNVWPLPYTANWSTASAIADVAQTIDGIWRLEGDGVRTTQLGYDRLIALGDVTWTNYEITVPVTVHGLDPVCVADINQCRGRPSVSLLARWVGHYDWDGSQPRYGYYPIGAFAGFFWDRSDLSTGTLDLDGSHFQNLARNYAKKINFGDRYIFKLRAETLPGQADTYRFKMWQDGQPEPFGWDLYGEEPIGAGLAAGSLVLGAHNTDVTFGTVTVTPLPSTPPPPSTQRDDFNTATLDPVWTFVDPVGDTTLSMTGTQLSLLVPGGAAHRASTWNNKGPRVLRAVSNTDLVAEVRFDSALTGRYQGQGIIFEQDANDYLRVDFFQDKTGTTMQVYSSRTVGGTPTKLLGVPVTLAAPLYLRVVRSGDMWDVRYSSDGSTWTLAGSFTHALNVNAVGILASNEDVYGTAYTVLADYFALTQ